MAASPESLLISIEGEVLSRDQPFLYADDLGVVRGDGIFEAFLVVDGNSNLFEPHLDRLDRSAEMMDITPPPHEKWVHALEVAKEQWKGGPEMVARLMVTRGRDAAGPTTSFMICDPVGETQIRQRSEGITAVTLEKGLDPELMQSAPWLLIGAKTLSYALNMAAGREAAKRGVDECIWVRRELVLEAPTSAVVALIEGRLVTPPPEVGILASITADRLVSEGRKAGWTVERRNLTVPELAGADGAWVLSSTRLASRIRELDGKTLADPGITDKVAALVAPEG